VITECVRPESFLSILRASFARARLPSTFPSSNHLRIRRNTFAGPTRAQIPDPPGIPPRAAPSLRGFTRTGVSSTAEDAPQRKTLGREDFGAASRSKKKNQLQTEPQHTTPCHFHRPGRVVAFCKESAEFRHAVRYILCNYKFVEATTLKFTAAGGSGYLPHVWTIEEIVSLLEKERGTFLHRVTRHSKRSWRVLVSTGNTYLCPGRNND